MKGQIVEKQHLGVILSNDLYVCVFDSERLAELNIGDEIEYELTIPSKRLPRSSSDPENYKWHLEQDAMGNSY